MRESLVAAYVAYARRHGLVRALLDGQNAFWDLEDDSLVRVAQALGFSLHYGELEQLLEALRSAAGLASN